MPVPKWISGKTKVGASLECPECRHRGVIFSGVGLDHVGNAPFMYDMMYRVAHVRHVVLVAGDDADL